MLAYAAFPKYNKFIPDAAVCCGICFICLYIVVIGLSAKLFIDTVLLPNTINLWLSENVALFRCYHIKHI